MSGSCALRFQFNWSGKLSGHWGFKKSSRDSNVQPRVGITIPFNPLSVSVHFLCHIEWKQVRGFSFKNNKGHIDDWGQEQYLIVHMPSSTARMLWPCKCRCGPGTITWDLWERKTQQHKHWETKSVFLKDFTGDIYVCQSLRLTALGGSVPLAIILCQVYGGTNQPRYKDLGSEDVREKPINVK